MKRFLELAESIEFNSKGEELLKALNVGLEEVIRISPQYGQRKAVIFTENLRTQRYLFDLLTDNGYADQVVMLNGVNNDPDSRIIYRA